MTATPPRPLVDPRRALAAGSVLIIAGGALGLVGLTLAIGGLASLARQRVQQMEVPPSQLARERLAKARAATAAGVNAWRGATDVPVA